MDNTTIRRVWAHVSRHPAMTMTERGVRLGIAPSTVWWALRRLAAAGYITLPPFNVRGAAIQVNIPLLVQVPARSIAPESEPVYE